MYASVHIFDDNEFEKMFLFVCGCWRTKRRIVTVGYCDELFALIACDFLHSFFRTNDMLTLRKFNLEVEGIIRRRKF